MDAVFVHPVHDFIQPFKVVFPFPGFQTGPGKDPQGNRVYVGLLHEQDVLFEDIGPVQPLIRVVVSSVEEFFFHEEIPSTVTFLQFLS